MVSDGNWAGTCSRIVLSMMETPINWKSTSTPREVSPAMLPVGSTRLGSSAFKALLQVDLANREWTCQCAHSSFVIALWSSS